MPNSHKTPLNVAVLAFEGMSPFHLTVPCIVFGDLSSHFTLKVCAESQDLLSTTAGFQLAASHGLDAFDSADIIIIPSWHMSYQPPSQALIAALQHAEKRGALVVGLCLGSYVLAAAGLLNQKQATTHWAFFDDFSSLFPDIQLETDMLYVECDNVITSAGTAAGMDCCLQIVRRILGSTEANHLARLLVVPPQRQGGQSQYVSVPMPERGTDLRLSQLLDDVLVTLNLPHTIDELAEKNMMSRRTFTRRFQAVTGKSFGKWLLAARLSHCQQLLESSTLSVEQIADACGFNNTVTLRHHFKKSFGISPSAWRKLFETPLSNNELRQKQG
ncbi:GlxA family transcriptional regulator [Enterovibrio norvegicus]|uniref:GlxA family transcriptional regulator n=1 Tax=Enterovibrio norvegicus TaxID=188144 RepID=UPI0018EBC81F|nr:helix-turn-helix domain-containing protein [Enterovibrio norvegicus]